MSDVPNRGDRYVFPAASNPAVETTVTRVAKNGKWADISCRDVHNGARWTKRQPLPVPGERVAPSETDGGEQR